VAALFIAGLYIQSCKSHDHPKGFALQRQIQDFGDDTAEKPIYLTGTKSIDSVDADKLIYDIFRIEIDEYPSNLKVYARVYDSNGTFVTHMADPYKEDSSITYFTSVTERLGKVYNIRNNPIDSFNVREFGANDSIPYNIVLSVDYSGSMKGVIDAIFEGTEIFVNLKMKYDNIGISTFNRDYDMKVPLMNDKDEILQIYNVRKKRGFGLFSAVYDAIDSSITLFDGTSTEVPRVLVIFTDGDDNYSKTEMAELLDSAKNNKIRIFTVAFGYSKDDNLRHMAKYTGGKFYKAYTKEELVAIFRDIYMSLRYYYYITYLPPEYWGYHKVIATVNVPERKDTLFAYGEYDPSNSDLAPWDSLGTSFARPIFFEFDSSRVREESYPIINEIVDKMMAWPRLKLEIQGHTDNVGTVEYNQNLSEERAYAVMEQIIKRGIDPSRLRSRGFGMSRPIATNETESGRAKNRRTQFVIIAK
jgi:outer membrane protein OmpA-like peptidoglycan-associated protein